MKRTLSLFSLALIVLLALFAFPVPQGLAAPQAQLTLFPTPTPGPDGKIFYTVQPGDTLWRISAITGVSVEKLRELNNLGADEVIIEGQRLLIGVAGPVEITPTPGPLATPRPAEPTPTQLPGWGIICVMLYEDLNGDSMRQEEEPFISGGAISVSNRSGSISHTADTPGGIDPVCFEELPEGDYNITVAIPQGYNPTTVLNRPLELKQGETSYLAFGAQRNSEEKAAIAETPINIPETPRQSPILGILGGLLLLVGAGLGAYATLLWRGRK